MISLRRVLLLVVLAAIFSNAVLAAGKPNIVLVMADDQGWGDMAYNGHPLLKTPNFDKAASTGLRFDRFYAAAPVCSRLLGGFNAACLVVHASPPLRLVDPAACPAGHTSDKFLPIDS